MASRYGDGALLYETGKSGPGRIVLFSGRARVLPRDGLGHAASVVEQGPRQFFAEVGDLSGRPSLVDVHAVGMVEATCHFAGGSAGIAGGRGRVASASRVP